MFLYRNASLRTLEMSTYQEKPGALGLQRFDRHQALWSSWTSPTNRPWRFYPWAPETTWPEPSASCHDSGQSESIGLGPGGMNFPGYIKIYTYTSNSY